MTLTPYHLAKESSIESILFNIAEWKEEVDIQEDALLLCQQRIDHANYRKSRWEEALKIKKAEGQLSLKSSKRF